jgi:sec-independent protein translocase protein TatB
MFSVPHIVVLFVVVLVLFGPHKLPELARGLGKLMAEFRKASNDFKMAFEEEMRSIERQNREAEWKKSQEEAEAKRKAEQASSQASAVSEPKILPEHSATPDAAPVEPVISPVSESVARESNSHEPPSTESSSISSDAGASPAHDHRQPA